MLCQCEGFGARCPPAPKSLEFSEFRRPAMKFPGALLAASMLAMPVLASAQPVTGLYVGAGAGLNIMQDESVKSAVGVATPGVKLETNLGAVGVGSIGWGFGNGLRAE